jgi:hypothetical protein
MQLAITGSHGLIGEAVLARFEARGDRVVRVSRPSKNPRWAEDLEGADAVIHLAGESIGARRWSAAQRAEILRSRTEGTRKVAAAIAGMASSPRVFLSASAIGFYGDRGDEVLTEESPPGTGFLAEVTQAWEEATHAATASGVRTVLLRTGVVQSAQGGALAKVLPLFRWGLGGALGPGDQYVSWISLADEVGAIVHAVDHEKIAGPVNAVAPNPVTARAYARCLGRALHRPTVLRVPGFALRIALGGEMADELLLASQRVRPDTLLANQYVFEHPDLESCFSALFGEGPSQP